MYNILKLRFLGGRMTIKQINKLLAGVLKNYSETITSTEVRDIILHRCYITGGCIPSMMGDEYVNDYDIYFRSAEDVKKVREYYVDQSKIPFSSEKKYRVGLITDNAINLSDKIQLITRFYGSPEDVTNEFDWAQKNYSSKLLNSLMS